MVGSGWWFGKLGSTTSYKYVISKNLNSLNIFLATTQVVALAKSSTTFNLFSSSFKDFLNNLI